MAPIMALLTTRWLLAMFLSAQVKYPLTLSTSSTDNNYFRLILLLSGYVFSLLQDSSER